MAKRSTLQRSGQAMFYNFLINEVLASQTHAGYQFWIVAPWITNFPLPAPYHVSFAEIIAIRHNVLHLFDVLRQMAANGGEVSITVGSDTRFHQELRYLSERSHRIAVRVLPKLHTKAYAGYYGALDGSLNLTDSGVNQNVELYTYYHDARNIAQLQQVCREHFVRAEVL
ncbi:MAG: hypothetical protein HC914_16280 [Chloroflexaceae bacterium]|nr:hypothetical protein [Chloroflexaceae bacterium]